ncbi:MAG: hypothetical protein ACLRTD_24550 [Bacteroides sp.]
MKIYFQVLQKIVVVILSVVCDKRVGEIYTSHSGNGIMLLKGITGEILIGECLQVRWLMLILWQTDD